MAFRSCCTVDRWSICTFSGMTRQSMLLLTSHVDSSIDMQQMSLQAGLL